MGNFWLNLARLKEVAKSLELFLNSRVNGKVYLDPKMELGNLVSLFYIQNPQFVKYEDDLVIKAKIAKMSNRSGYIIPQIKVQNAI